MILPILHKIEHLYHQEIIKEKIIFPRELKNPQVFTPILKLTIIIFDLNL